MDDKPNTPEDRTNRLVKERAFGTFHRPGFEIPTDFDELPGEDMRYWRGEGDDDEEDQLTKPPTGGYLDEPLTD